MQLGKPSSGCIQKGNPLNCDDAISISNSDLSDFQTPFDLSDDETVRNSSSAWQIVQGRDNPLVTDIGTKDISFIYMCT